MTVSTSPIAIGWLNQNALRAYPFHEGVGLRPNDSSGALVSGGWSVPNCLIVDMSVSVPVGRFDPYLYLSRMSVVGGTVSLAFSGRSGETAFTVVADDASHVENKPYAIAGTGDFLGATGCVCIGDLSRFIELTPEGAYGFEADETLVEPTCIRPSSECVSSIRTVDPDGYTSARLNGDVAIMAGSNIRLDCDTENNEIWISADPNSGYEEKCDCRAGSDLEFVKSVNGISVADVKIVGSECVDVSTDPESGVVTISDKCSTPCCGCAETTFINQTVNDLQTSVNTLMGNVATLGQRLESFITSYVLSRKTIA